METAELTDLIQNYVWESAPLGENLFYETMHVQVQPDGTGAVTTAAQFSNDLHVVNAAEKAAVHIALSYNFHDTATVVLREPNPQEIDGLFNQTVDFLTQLLLDELPESSSIDKGKQGHG